MNLANKELFTKIFLANIHRYTENVFGLCTDCSLFAKFFLTDSFFLPVWPTKNFACHIFPMYVLPSYSVCVSISNTNLSTNDHHGETYKFGTQSARLSVGGEF